MNSERRFHIPDYVVEFQRMKDDRAALETLTVPVLGHRCSKKHRKASEWTRCAYPGPRSVYGKLGRMVVIMPCRQLSAVVVDSREAAEAALAWTCGGACRATDHRLFLVTRKELPEGIAAGPAELPKWDLGFTL